MTIDTPKSANQIEQQKIPIIIVTGFLGSGKTTFINQILKHSTNKKLAIIENEFASLGIDKSLINSENNQNNNKEQESNKTNTQKTENKIFELNNGCVCCTMDGELTGIFKEIIENKSKTEKKQKNNQNYDAIILETTGVADPSPIITNLLSNPLISEHFRLDCIYTLVDSKHFFKQIDKQFEAKKQITFANKILINKTDLVDEIQIKAITQKITQLNPDAKIEQTQNSITNLKNLFNENKFNISKVNQIQNSINQFAFTRANSTNNLQSPLAENKSHTNEIESFGIKLSNPIEIEKFDYFMKMLIHLNADNLYRTKGIVNIKNSNFQLLFQGVHDSINWFPGRMWKKNENRESKLVFIGKNLDKQDIKKALLELTEP